MSTSTPSGALGLKEGEGGVQVSSLEGLDECKKVQDKMQQVYTGSLTGLGALSKDRFHGF